MDREKLQKLSELTNVILNSKNIKEAIHHTSDIVKEIIDVERISIFIYDYEKNLVYTCRADYTDKIEMPANRGIVGKVIDTKQAYITNDAYNDENFNKEVDIKSGFVTKNILAVPIVDTVGKLIGVIELINKKGEFNDKDLAFAKVLAQYISEPLKLQIGLF